MKRCFSCKRILPESKYFPTVLKRGGGSCKDCMSIMSYISMKGEKKVESSDFDHLKKREIDRWIK